MGTEDKGSIRKKYPRYGLGRWSEGPQGPSGSVRPINQNQDLVGVIPDLAVVTVLNFGDSVNWDGDIEDDGIKVGWIYFDSSGEFLNANDIPDEVIIHVNVRLFGATLTYGDTKASTVPFFEKDLLVAPGIRNDKNLDSSMPLAFEEYVPLMPSNVIIDDGLAHLVVEVRLTQSDGSEFADRSGARLPIEEG